MKNRHFLVTGASGFLGHHLIQTLLKNPSNKSVVALIRNSKEWQQSDWTKGLHGLEILEGCVTKPDIWIQDPKLKTLDGIFHLAAIVQHSRKNPDKMLRTNIDGTLNMIRLAHQYRCRIVFVSTSGAVGCFRTEKEVADENSPYCEGLRWPYYDSKILAERQAKKLSQELGVDLIIVRPPLLLGPEDPKHRATKLIFDFLEGKIPFLLNGGIHFSDVRDVASALSKIMEIKKPRLVYHLPGHAMNLKTFFKILKEISGTPAPRLKLSNGIALLLAKVSDKLQTWFPNGKLSWLPDPVLIEMATRFWNMRSLYAKDELGFQPREARETLHDTIQWLSSSKD